MARRKTTRAAQGSGTIRQRKNGRWEARYTVGRDPGTGKQVRRSIYGDTQAEVRKKLQEVCVAIDDGKYMEPSKMTLAMWLDTWLEEYCGNLKGHSPATYETRCRVHIKPALGAVTLSALSVTDIQAFCNKLRKQDKAPKTIKSIIGILHKALSQAVTNGYIRANPCHGITPIELDEPEIKPLVDDEVGAFLKAIEGSEYEALFTLTMDSGMREGEVIGLTWDRIDFTKGTIKIDRQLLKEKKKGGSYVFAPPKRNSKRTIAPGADVMKRLEAVRLRQKERKLKAGPAWDNSLNLVFTNEIGGHYCHSTVEHTFKRIVTAMGLENRRFHDLRHTYAVLALRAGVDIKTLSKSLGHKTVAFTLDVYCHVTEEMQQEAASKMEAMRSTIKARAHRK